MKLRSQLLLTGALAGLLPLVAYHAVQQMDVAWRDIRKSDLSREARSTASLLVHAGVLPSRDHYPPKLTPTDLYVERVGHTMILDGYDDEWAHMRQRARIFPDSASTQSENASQANVGQTVPDPKSLQVKFRASSVGSRLHLFFDIKDDQLVYHNPGVTKVASNYGADYEFAAPDEIATGDHILLYTLEKEGAFRESIIRAIAPGPTQAIGQIEDKDGIRSVRTFSSTRAFWTVATDGYRVEVSMPLPDSGVAFGFRVHDIDVFGEVERRHWAGTVAPGAEVSGILLYRSDTTEALLSDVIPAGSRARVFNRNGSLHADLNRLYEKPDSVAMLDPANSSFFNALLFRFFEWIITTRHHAVAEPFPMSWENQLDLDSDEIEDSRTSAAGEMPAPVRSYDTVDRDRVSGSLVQIDAAEDNGMWLLYESNEQSTNAFTSSAMVRLFSLLTLVSLLVAAILFGYASWLSWRMRRLSRQTQSAVSGDGRILNVFAGSAANDEIGEISRSFATLVERSAGYTRYLESLASKLSHELRTPLSVVKTSLENIDRQSVDETAQLMLTRAQGGADQLSVLIRSMSEATRLEHAVQRAEFVHFELRGWLSLAVDSYRDVYPDHQFKLYLDANSEYTVHAVPDLLQQALDKLISNATDFSEPGETIILTVGRDGDVVTLRVYNKGNMIEPTQLTHIFEPMYSRRRGDSVEAHLGIGLYIVKLIAEAHGGRALAQNDPKGTGVFIGFSMLGEQQT